MKVELIIPEHTQTVLGAILDRIENILKQTVWWRNI